MIPPIRTYLNENINSSKKISNKNNITLTKRPKNIIPSITNINAIIIL